MRADWNNLVREFKGFRSSGVYDVNCEVDGRELCEKHNITNWPEVRYGHPKELKKYNGDRNFDEMKTFAEHVFPPQCNPIALNLCHPSDKAVIENLLLLSKHNLVKKKKKTERKAFKLEQDYSKRYRKFSSKYRDIVEEQDEQEELVASDAEIKVKFEKTKAKASNAEVAKQEKREKKAEERAAKFEKKKTAVEVEKTKFDKERHEMEGEFALAKHMTFILDRRTYDTEDL